MEAMLDLDLGRNPIKDAAGPNDYPHLRNKVEPRAKKSGYFDFKQVDGGAYRMTKLPNFDEIIAKTRDYLGDKMPEVDQLLELMLTMDTQQAELFCTVFAAWNNLLLEGQQPSDEAIVFEAREDCGILTS